MADIATLGLAINSQSVGTATQALNSFATSGKAAAAAAAQLGTSTSVAAKAHAAVATAATASASAHKGLSGEAQAAAHSMRSMVESLAMGMPVSQVLTQQFSHLSYAASGQGGLAGAFKSVGSALLGAINPAAALGIGVAAVGGAIYLAYSHWKSFTLALDDGARAAGTTTREFSALQAAASFKGIDGKAFGDAMAHFSQEVYQAKDNMGGLALLLRANGTYAKDFGTAFDRVADIIKNAKDDQQRLALLQQAGLPATMEWVRLLSQGAAGVKAAKDQAAAFAADDNLIRSARKFDETWNRAWTNFGLNSRSAFQTAIDSATGFYDKMDQRAKSIGNSTFWQHFYSPESKNTAGVQNLNAFEGRFSGGSENPARGNLALQDALRAKADRLRNDPSKDPNRVQNDINRAQQYLGLLGSTTTAMEAQRGVELQVQSARLSGVSIDQKRVETLKRLAYENNLGLTAIRASTDAYRVEASTVGMATGEAAAYTAAQNAINQAKRDGKELSDTQITAIKREAAQLGEAAKAADNMRFAYEGLVRGPMQTFRQELQNGATFFDALKKAGLSALDALSSRLMDMASQNLFRSIFGGMGGLGGGGSTSTMGFNPIAGAFSFGGASANGNAFSGGNVIPFARGGIVSQPTMFPMANGAAGLMGEAEPEAIIPLRRGADGKLGVSGGSGGGATHVAVGGMNVTIQGNADNEALKELRRMQSEFGSRVEDAVRKAKQGRRL